MKKFGYIIIATLISFNTMGQVSESELLATVKALDSLLFNVGFNQCNIEVFDSLVSGDYEMYHDQSGTSPSKEVFMNGIENGLCKLNYKPTRELVKGSMKIYPLKNNGKIYGILQVGEHEFYAQYEGKPGKELTSIAKFDHLWLLEDEKWKLSRVISYDHIAKN